MAEHELESPSESPQKPEPGTLVKPKHGNGFLRHGSRKGNTPGSGRPKDEFLEACAELASDALRLGYVRKIIKNPDHPQFMRALEWAADRGYGKVPNVVAGDPDNPIVNELIVSFVRE